MTPQEGNWKMSLEQRDAYQEGETNSHEQLDVSLQHTE